MNDQKINKSMLWKRSLLGVIALVMILTMLRLGVWQLSRADEKSTIVAQLVSKSELPPVSVEELMLKNNFLSFRFTNVKLTGRYQNELTVYVDNQVVKGQVGYQVFTPFKIEGSSKAIMVGRGFIGVGASREALPQVPLVNEEHSIIGRLNRPPAAPPLWNDAYDVSEGARWQFLPINQLMQQLDLDLLPLVVELAPIKANEKAGAAGLIQQWPEISDQWVAKHQGYAFQWFAMAAAFLVACLVLLIKTSSRKARSE